jgi:hypothetical protein
MNGEYALNVVKDGDMPWMYWRREDKKCALNLFRREGGEYAFSEVKEGY